MSDDSAYYRFALKIVTDLTGAIAVPAVLAAFGGKWLDEHYHTGHRYLFLLLALAFGLTAYSLVKKSTHYRIQYELITKDSKKDV